MIIKEAFCYPTNLMYAPRSTDKKPQESYYVTSVAVTDQNEKISGLFWKIVRVSDGALQYMDFNSEPKTTLFLDPKCSYPYALAISDDWSVTKQSEPSSSCCI